ncbi:MAG TPA: AsmA family protein [Gammaproteobacteria bacterium]|nr:AsmA family protein [Gammaproteobacteria bacterium]
MRVVKIFAGVLGGIVLLSIVAAAVLVATFDPNRYKDYVTRWAEQRTGRELTIGSDLHLKLFPWLAVETGDIEIGNAQGFGEGPFATIERASAEVKLWPLLAKRVEVGKIDIQGLQLNLAVDASGRGNWEDLAARGPEPAPDAGGAQAGSSWLDTLDVAGVEVTDSSLRWSDATGLRYAIAVDEISSGPIRPGQPTPLHAALEVRDAAAGWAYSVGAETEATLADSGVELRDTSATIRSAGGTPQGTGRLTAALIAVAPDGTVRLGETRLEATLEPSAASTKKHDLAAGWSKAAYAPGAGTLEIDGLSTRIDGIDAAWQVDARGLPAAPELDGSVRIKAASAGAVLELLGLTPPAGVPPAELGTFDLAGDFRTALASSEPGADSGYAIKTLALEKIEGAWRGVKISGAGSLEGGNKLAARFEIPAFTADDTLRKIVAANLPDGMNAAALQRVALSGRVEADLDGGRFALADAQAELLGAKLTGSMEAVPQANGTLYRGALKTSRFAPDAFAAFLGKNLSEKIAPSELGTLSLDTRFSYDSGTDSATLEPLAFEAFGLSASGKLTAANVTGTPVLEGDAQLPTFSPRDLLRRFGQPAPETSDPKALQKAGIATHFRIDGGRGRFTNMTLALDDSRITGEFTVAGVRNPDYRFALAIDRIDADRYLPPPQSQAKAGQTTAGEIELPAEALSNLTLDGTLKVGQLKLANLDLAEVSTGIAVGNGEAHLSNAGAKLYGGRFDGAFDVKAAGKEPGLTLTGKAAGLDLAPLIAALTRSPANFSGKGDFDLRLAGKGATVIENVKTAGGHVTFSMKDGAIEGFNLGRTLCAVYNSTQKQPAPADQPKVTRYQVVSGAADVANGVASSSDLLARASFMDVTGKGRLELAAQRLDYSLEAKLTGKIGIAGCESMEPLIGESIPLTLRGTVTDPSISPDFSAIIQRRLKNEVKERLQDRLLKGILK